MEQEFATICSFFYVTLKQTNTKLRTHTDRQTHTHYLPVSLAVIFDRKGRWGGVREGRGVSIGHHVLRPMHRGCFGEGAGVKMKGGRRGGRGETVGRRRRMTELWREERYIVRQLEEFKRRRKIRETHSYIHTHTLHHLAPNTTTHTSSFGGLGVSPSEEGFPPDSVEALVRAGAGAGLGSPPSCE